MADKRIRIEDVASAAGVSTQTVSRVLNNRAEVRPETREKVLKAMASLGYKPNLFARGLAGKRSHIIGMIAEDLSEPMMAHLIAAVELEARKYGYFLLVSSNINPDPEHPIHAQMIASSHVDGILFSRLGIGEQERLYLQELMTHKIPLVALGDWPGVEGVISSVGLAEEDGGYQAVRYLLELGHRHIGMITGPTDNSAMQARSHGYEKALTESGLSLEPALIVDGNWDFGSGFIAAKRLIEQTPNVTAVFCQNDRMAIGAMNALSQSGRRVPQDISVIGYDDIPDSEFASPPLTTIHQSTQEIGYTATRLLLDVIENPAATPRRILVKTTLVERQSCQPYVVS